MPIYAGADWLKESLKVGPMSEHGEKVAFILGQVWKGVYHLDSKMLKKIDWTDPDIISITIWDSLATYDFSNLTELVVLCHDNCVRLEISPAMRYLRLLFHRRQREGQHIYDRHPTMEDTVKNIREKLS